MKVKENKYWYIPARRPEDVFINSCGEWMCRRKLFTTGITACNRRRDAIALLDMNFPLEPDKRG